MLKKKRGGIATVVPINKEITLEIRIQFYMCNNFLWNAKYCDIVRQNKISYETSYQITSLICNTMLIKLKIENA